MEVFFRDSDAGILGKRKSNFDILERMNLCFKPVELVIDVLILSSQ